MKCGIARVDNSGLSMVSSFLVAARLRATAAELRTQLITAGSDAEFVCFPQSRNKERILDTRGKNGTR
jgi:hypothetical protein